jgi:hypothetical protein
MEGLFCNFLLSSRFVSFKALWGLSLFKKNKDKVVFDMHTA